MFGMLSFQFDGSQNIALQILNHVKNWNGSSQKSSYLLASDRERVLWSAVLPLGCHHKAGGTIASRSRKNEEKRVPITLKNYQIGSESSENHFPKCRILSCCGSITNKFISYLGKCNSVACKLLKIRRTAWTAYHQRQIALSGSQELSNMLQSHQVYHIFCHLNRDQPISHFEFADNHTCTRSVDRIAGFLGPCQFLA